MEDMIIHKNIFDICKLLNKNQTTALSDSLYDVLNIMLNSQYSYSQKTKQLKGNLIRTNNAVFRNQRAGNPLGR